MDINIGDRKYHHIMGWVKICLPDNGHGKVLADIEADEIEYQTDFGVRKRFKRDKKGNNFVCLTIDELHDSENELTEQQKMQRLWMRPEYVSSEKSNG